MLQQIDGQESSWEALAGVANGTGFDFAVCWLSSALWAQRVWLQTHDLNYAGMIEDYKARANDSFVWAMDFRRKTFRTAA